MTLLCGDQPSSFKVACTLQAGHDGKHRHEAPDFEMEWESHADRAERLREDLRFALEQLTYHDEAQDHARILILQEREGIL